MNTPAHLAVGACIGQIVITAYGRLSAGFGSRAGYFLCGILAFLLGAFSHLLLDLMPHYAWIVYLPFPRSIPLYWLWLEAFFGLIVAVPCLYWSRDHRFVAALGMCGAMYPDLEKVAFFDFRIPERFVLFGEHGTYISSRDGGIAHGVLVVAEIIAIAILMYAAHVLAKRRAPAG